MTKKETSALIEWVSMQALIAVIDLDNGLTTPERCKSLWCDLSRLLRNFRKIDQRSITHLTTLYERACQ